MGSGLDCAPQAEPTPRRGSASQRRGPVHSSEVRATSPGFREIRYLDPELTRRGVGTAKNTPGPGQYIVRPSMERGTKFAGARSKCSRAATVATVEAFAKSRAANKARFTSGLAKQERPSLPASRSLRLSTPLMGRESPGPAYDLPSDFDIKHTNKKTFHPPPCRTKLIPSPWSKVRKRGRGAGLGVSAKQCRKDMAHVCRELDKAMSGVVAKLKGSGTGIVGLPVSTSLGRGLLLRIRADGMSFVRLPWGVLYTMEELTRGSHTTYPVVLDDPGTSASLPARPEAEYWPAAQDEPRPIETSPKQGST